MLRKNTNRVENDMSARINVVVVHVVVVMVQKMRGKRGLWRCRKKKEYTADERKA